MYLFGLMFYCLFMLLIFSFGYNKRLCYVMLCYKTTDIKDRKCSTLLLLLDSGPIIIILSAPGRRLCVLKTSVWINRKHKGVLEKVPFKDPILKSKLLA